MLDNDIIDFMDLMDYTFSFRFMSTWEHKYNIKFIKLFQTKLLDSFKSGKIIKTSTLTNFLIKKHGYNKDVIDEFYKDIDISIYHPFVQLT